MRVLDAGLVAVFVLATPNLGGRPGHHRRDRPSGPPHSHPSRQRGVLPTPRQDPRHRRLNRPAHGAAHRECAAASSSRGRGAHRHCGGRHSPARVPQTEQLFVQKTKRSSGTGGSVVTGTPRTRLAVIPPAVRQGDVRCGGHGDLGYVLRGLLCFTGSGRRSGPTADTSTPPGEPPD